MPQPVAPESESVPAAPLPRPRSGIGRRFGVVAGEILILVGIWLALDYVFGIVYDWRLVAAVGGVIVLGGIVPERLGPLATGLGLLGVAALEFFYYGNLPLAALLGVAAAFYILSGVGRLRSRSSRRAPRAQ